MFRLLRRTILLWCDKLRLGVDAHVVGGRKAKDGGVFFILHFVYGDGWTDGDNTSTNTSHNQGTQQGSKLHPNKGITTVFGPRKTLIRVFEPTFDISIELRWLISNAKLFGCVFVRTTWCNERAVGSDARAVGHVYRASQRRVQTRSSEEGDRTGREGIAHDHITACAHELNWFYCCVWRCVLSLSRA